MTLRHFGPQKIRNIVFAGLSKLVSIKSFLIIQKMNDSVW